MLHNHLVLTNCLRNRFLQAYRKLQFAFRVLLYRNRNHPIECATPEQIVKSDRRNAQLRFEKQFIMVEHSHLNRSFMDFLYALLAQIHISTIIENPLFVRIRSLKTIPQVVHKYRCLVIQLGTHQHPFYLDF
jgi:hypothetical protein